MNWSPINLIASIPFTNPLLLSMTDNTLIKSHIVSEDNGGRRDSNDVSSSLEAFLKLQKKFC